MKSKNLKKLPPSKRNFYIKTLAYFADKLQVDVHDNTVNVPADLGFGSIKGFYLEEGLTLRYFNFTLKQEMEYDIINFDENRGAYNFFFFLNEGDFFSQKSGGRNSFLFPNKYERNLKIRRGYHIYTINLNVSIPWLETNHPIANLAIIKSIKKLTIANKPTFISEEMDSITFSATRQIMSGLDQHSFVPLQIKAGSFLLLNNFLNKITNEEKKDIQSVKSLHFNTIIEVEKKLDNFIIIHQRPNLKIKNLAEEFNMSISTLRRHFKIVFGQNIHEYFQKKKMMWAKIQLEKGEKNITEIAGALGFVKPANFSTAFRKEFGILPKKIKGIILL